MTKIELIKALSEFKDNANILIDVVLYNAMDASITTSKRFDITSLCYKVSDTAIILVQCPDNDTWDENNCLHGE